jgi:hypothetical protein
MWKLQTVELLVLGLLFSSAELNQECQIIRCHTCFLSGRVELYSMCKEAAVVYLGTPLWHVSEGIMENFENPVCVVSATETTLMGRFSDVVCVRARVAVRYREGVAMAVQCNVHRPELIVCVDN